MVMGVCATGIDALLLTNLPLKFPIKRVLRIFLQSLIVKKINAFLVGILV